jgi:hypothetical protein
MTINYAQLFCTVTDLVADKQAPGVDEARMFQAIKEASAAIDEKIGWFLPVTLTRSFCGRGSKTLFVPPLLAITSILNDDVTLTSADYILKPDDGFWANGPYARILVDPDATLLSAWWNESDGVQITGRWGKYERSGAIDATVQDTTQQSATQLTLKVSNGGVVSPGMVLPLGTEQEAITGWDAPTAAVTALNGGINASEQIITVDNGALVNIGENIRIGFEQMRVRDKETHQLEVIRSWNGTRAVIHADDAAVDVYRTVKVERGVNGTTAATHANGLALSRYFVPDDILFLAKELATLSVNKAQSGYQGRTGNDATGVVFFNDAFPQFDIEFVRKKYSIPRA